MHVLGKVSSQTRALFEPGEREGLRRSLGRAARIVVVAISALIWPVAAWADDNQNALHSASKQEHSISVLWWVMLVGASIGFGVIVILLFLGWIRRNRDNLPFGGRDRAGTAIVIGLGVFVPIVILSLLFVWSDLYVIKTTEAPAPGSTQMSVRVIGHDWWWEVRYPGTPAVTANEIHIPVRTGVDMVGTTADVIHSFWVPELNRKVDLIPGRVNRLLLDANHPGEYRGQCAEFCGQQHAHMAMYVFADTPEAFRRWLANEQRPARKPATARARRGEHLFLSLPCSGCHMIRGTSARGTIGPELTHLATRTTLAALTLPNDPPDLARWIEDPQRYKPGSKMPGFSLTRSDRAALVAYLDGLK
jgi:cytochrome c oxidase subunit II